MYPIVTALSVAISIALHGHSAQTDIPSTFPGNRLKQFIAAFNTKDPQKIGFMVGTCFSKGTLKVVSKDDWTTKIVGWTDLAPIDVVSVLKSTPTTIVVSLRGNTNLPLGVRLDLEADPPYGIMGASMGAPNELLSAAAPSKYTKWKSIDELADIVKKEYKLPSISIAYQQTGQPAQQVSLGLRSNRGYDQLESDDRLLVGSVGKSMTGTLVAKLIEMKKLAWNTTLEEALPNIKMLDVYKKVTIDQLLHGVPGLPQDFRFTTEDLVKIMSKAETNTDVRKVYVADLLSREPISDQVAEPTNYSAEYAVAGYVVEKLIGQTYEWLMQRYVFDPMKLTTALIQPVGTAGQVGSQGNAYGHMISDAGYAPYLLSNVAADIMLAPAGADISCSIGDMLKFGEFHLKGLKGQATIISEDSYKRLHSPIGQDDKNKDGCGWIINPPFAGEACHFLTGTDGYWYIDMTIWPDSNLVIVAVTNAGTIKKPSPTLQVTLAVRDRVEGR